MVLSVYCRVKDNPINYKILSDNISSLSIPYKKKLYEFNVNNVWQNLQNKDVFNNLMRSNLSKINYWILFGYTGTGKTYTTNGILNELFSFYNKGISISAIQIYNNEIFDLLTKKKLKFFKTTQLVIKNKSTISINNKYDITTFMNLLKKNRSQNSTSHNAVSSRSHAIIHVITKEAEFIIVDMAGQETSINYKNKKIQQEGSANNLNMLALKECIRSLYNKDKYIPYRRTLLTFALKPMFSGTFNTSFICTITTNMNIFNQIDSLKYANQLFECSKQNKQLNCDNFLKDYNKYIIDSGWYTSNDIKIWREIKKKNYKNISNISKYLIKKIELLTTFKNILKKYQKINPEIFDNL